MSPSLLAFPADSRAARLRCFAVVLCAVVSCVSACTRRLDDRPCPCAQGWTCCASQNLCLPAGAIDSCPGDSATPVVLPTVCTADGWCGATPPFTSIWGSAADDIWVVASDLAAAGVGWPTHFDGKKWEITPQPSPDLQAGGSVKAIWGTGRRDVFGVGDGAIFHFDGSTWTPQDSAGAHLWAAVGGTAVAMVASGFKE